MEKRVTLEALVFFIIFVTPATFLIFYMLNLSFDQKLALFLSYVITMISIFYLIAKEL